VLVAALDRDIVDQPRECEGRNEIEEPVHLIGRRVYRKVESGSHCREPNSHSVADDRGSLRFA
jgi:hypothetical protein